MVLMISCIVSNNYNDNRSVGATIVEMLKSHPPWFEFEPTAAMFKIVMNDTKPDLPPYCSEQAHHFIELCFIK